MYVPSNAAPPWRLRSRLKTFSAALVLCLNLGIDPPDVVKTTPCAKLECWVDPESLPPNKALEGIGRSELDVPCVTVVNRTTGMMLI